jgi:hypothetical protein
MLTELDIFFTRTEANPKPSQDEYKVGAFIIDEEAVEVGIYSNEFCSIIESSKAIENQQYEDGDYLIDFVNKETEQTIQIRLNERLSSIILSDPIFVLVTQETRWVVQGSKYINSEFVR